MIAKPPASCPIRGSQGFAPFVGPSSARISFLAEAAGRTEAYKSQPLVGESGFVFDRLLEQAGLERGSVRIGNVRGCHPPNDWLIGAPWENSPCETCDLAVEQLLEGRPRDSVIVTLGGYALRKLMGYSRIKGKEEGGIRVQDFHGAPVRHPRYPVWIVPTFHPSYLNRTALRLFKTSIFDIRVAMELAAGEWQYDMPELVIDPPVDWLEAWAEQYLAAVAQDPEATWLAVDLEWRDKAIDEGEVEAGEVTIEFCNLSCHPDEGITFPWVEPYISVAKKILLAGGRQVYHNAPGDIRNLHRAGVDVPWNRHYDSMDAFHVLHPAHPRGLGYVAPFASRCPPWKHLGNTNGTYRAMDGVQTLRVMRWLYERLHREGMWPVYERHIMQLDALALRPAEAVGLPFDKEALTKFNDEMQEICRGLEAEMQPLIPKEVLPLAGPLVRRPEGENVVELKEQHLIKVCAACQKENVHAKHRCDDKALVPRVELVERVVSRYYRQEAFNPASPKQVLAYIKFRGHKPGRAKKTGEDSSDKKTLARLAKTGDPLYGKLIKHRAAGKMGGTYGAGLIPRIDSAGRIHGEMAHAPWTMRTNSKSPNLQNMADHVEHAEKFKKTVVAAPGCRLAKCDFSGIEAVKVGYFSGDPRYIRLAKLSVHSYVQSHLVKEPADLQWSDADIKTHFAVLKERFPEQYEKAKRCVHGRNYGLTEFGMADYYPEVFPKRADAERVIKLYEEICPALPKWWKALRDTADKMKKLGGPGDLGHYLRHPGTPGPHPFGYVGEFFEVYRWQRRAAGCVKTLGDDGKRCVAFFPQSSAGGVLFDAVLKLFDPESRLYVGDAFFGRTPLRALIHDEIFLEIPDERLDEVLWKVREAMTAPVLAEPCPPAWGIGDHLTIGVAMKVGRNWAPGTAANPEGMKSYSFDGKSAPEDLAADVQDFAWVPEEDEAA